MSASALCFTALKPPCPQEDDTPEMFDKLEGRAAAVLRNLSHSVEQHKLLIDCGAVVELTRIMNMTKVI